MMIAACQLPDIQRDVEKALAIVASYAEAAEKQGANLVCFPECYLQGYVVDESSGELALDLSSSAFERVLKQLTHIKPVLVIGLIEIAGENIYNSAVVIKQGVLLGTYRKVKLMGGELGVFEPGSEYPVFEVDGLRFGINICNDLNYPECIESVSIQGVDLLVCPCNNMMRREIAETWKYKHNEIRAKRCLEASLSLISSDVTGTSGHRISYGPTAVISKIGEVVAQMPLLEPGLLIHELDLNN